MLVRRVKLVNKEFVEKKAKKVILNRGQNWKNWTQGMQGIRGERGLVGQKGERGFQGFIGKKENLDLTEKQLK